MRHVRIYSVHYVAETVCHRCGKENFRDDEKNWRIRQREREREKWCEEREKISFLEKLKSWEEKGQIYRKNFKTRWRKIRASMKSEVKFGTEK